MVYLMKHSTHFMWHQDMIPRGSCYYINVTSYHTTSGCSTVELCLTVFSYFLFHPVPQNWCNKNCGTWDGTYKRNLAA